MLKGLWNLFIWLLLGLPGLLLSLIYTLGGAFFNGVSRGIGKGKVSETHGDASFAKDKQLRANGNRAGGGFKVGLVENRPVYADREASVVMVGARGSGKSLTAGSSIRSETENSLILLDPSGDWFRDHKETLEAKGYQVVAVDLRNPSAGVRYDPLSYFRRSNNLNRDMEDFAQLAVQDDGEDKVGKHFVELCRGLLVSAIVAGIKYGKPQNSLGSIAAMLAGENRTVRDAYITNLGTINDPLVKMGLVALGETGKNEKGSVVTTIARKFRPWIDPSVMEVSKGGTWTWEDFLTAQRPQAVFLITGIGQKATVAPYTRLFVGLAVLTAQRMFNTYNTPLPRGLHIYADEGDLLGDCQPIVLSVTQLRKVGVNVWLNYQSISQLKGNFPKTDAETLMGNLDWLVPGGLKDIGFYKEVSDLMGDRTILARSESKSSQGRSEGEHEAPMKLMKADQLRRLPYNEMVAILGSLSAKVEKPWVIKDEEVKWR